MSAKRKFLIFDLICTAALLTISVMVFAGIMNNSNMWAWIAGYWLMLSIKNIALFAGHEV